MQFRRHDLTKKTWIDIYNNILSYDEIEITNFWNKHPDEHHKIMIMGKLTSIPRWQALYGEGNYKFSGTISYGNPQIPEFVEKCFEISRQLYPCLKWNGALVNWYKDGSHYIGSHSDDERDLVPNTPILSFSFGGVRIFRLKKKTEAKDNEIERIDFCTENNSLIVMGGECQKEYKHEITKTAKHVEPRINITIRCFKYS